MHTCFSFVPANLLRSITAAVVYFSVLPAAFSAGDNDAGKIHDLGVQYINGDGVSADTEKGRYYIHQSALLHFPLAQYHLGILFYTGEGGDKSTACARWWLGKSALAGGDINMMAQQVLADIYQETADNPAEQILLTQPANIARCEKLPESMVTKAAAQTLQQIISAAETLPAVPPFLAQKKRFIRQYGQLTNTLAAQVPLLWSSLSAPAVKQVPPAADEITITLFLPEVIAAEPPVTIHPSETIIPDSIVSPAVPENKVSPPVQNKNPLPASGNTGRNPRTAPGHHYTLQLSSAATPDGLYHSARRHKLSNYLVYETIRHNRRWYVLVYGDYPDLSSAKSALRSLPSAFSGNKPWIRSLKQVQSELP